MSVSHISGVSGLSGQSTSTSYKFLANTPVVTSVSLSTSASADVRGFASFTSSSGGTFVPTPVNLMSMDFNYGGAGAVSFALPSVASLNAYFVSLRIPNVFNSSFEFKIFNASSQTITITNGGDTNWVSISNPSGAATILLNKFAICRIYLSGVAGPNGICAIYT